MVLKDLDEGELFHAFWVIARSQYEGAQIYEEDCRRILGALDKLRSSCASAARGGQSDPPLRTRVRLTEADCEKLSLIGGEVLVFSRDLQRESIEMLRAFLQERLPDEGAPKVLIVAGVDLVDAIRANSDWLDSVLSKSGWLRGYLERNYEVVRKGGCSGADSSRVGGINGP